MRCPLDTLCEIPYAASNFYPLLTKHCGFSMFGIGLPEMIVILAVALIVVGPEKLPELARSLAKGVLELKRTINQVKGNLSEEGAVIHSVTADLHKTTADLTNRLLDDNTGNGSSDERPGTDSGIIDLQPVNKNDIPGPRPDLISDTPSSASPTQQEGGPDATPEADKNAPGASS